MPANRMTFKMGGEAGQGVESGGASLAKALARSGLHVFACRTTCPASGVDTTFTRFG
jgi:Pyruvate/2-oxoacid:ferredoxin oxidoreductase gamma subunit